MSAHLIAHEHLAGLQFVQSLFNERALLIEFASEQADMGQTAAFVIGGQDQGYEDRLGRTTTLKVIRVFEERGWAQVLPDPDEPLVHIYAEGRTSAESQQLEAEFRRLVEEIMETEETAAVR